MCLGFVEAGFVYVYIVQDSLVWAKKCGTVASKRRPTLFTQAPLQRGHWFLLQRRVVCIAVPGGRI